ncbi:MAG: N-acetyl-gamma-glutamyl-phosphate reductase [Actinobacteria bacterium]|nr:N-acetyl-gamma-glutamyl-phosphate reductase [Actinomycetota bacterium]
MGLEVGVLGASGYSGGELLRLLAAHPALSLGPVAADRARSSSVRLAHPHLGAGGTFASPDQAVAAEVDVLFSCLPSGALEELGEPAAHLVVDLSDDHRADDGWLYGLTEYVRDHLSGATRIANPGCYPTASLLCLVPFAAAGLIEAPVVIDAISGTSGAGRKTDDAYSLASLSGSIKAYGTTSHRHVPEIERGLASFGGLETAVSFTPHLAPMPRGLLVTARANLAGELDDVGALEVLHDAYAGEQYIEVIEEWPETKAVSGSNRAIVSARVDARTGFLICSCAIDNLGKGAAGQALQNANMALGLEESLGLSAVGMWP